MSDDNVGAAGGGTNNTNGGGFGGLKRRLSRAVSRPKREDRTTLDDNFQARIRLRDAYSTHIKDVHDSNVGVIEPNKFARDVGETGERENNLWSNLGQCIALNAANLGVDNNDYTNCLMEFAKIAKDIGSSYADYQTQSLKLTRPLRQYYEFDIKEHRKDVELLKAKSKEMDYWKLQVKGSKSLERLKTKENSLKTSIAEFDLQADKVITALNNHPADINSHRLLLGKQLELSYKFHYSVAEQGDQIVNAIKPKPNNASQRTPTLMV